MMGYGYGMMGIFGMIIPLMLIGGFIYIVVRLVQGNKVNYNTKSIEDDSINILNQRFANGEISEEEYQQKKKILKDE